MNNNEFGKEVWKPIKFDFEFTNDCRFEVSNLGRVRSFNKVSQGRILNGSTTGGYKIIRLKLYRPRTEKEQQKFDELKAEVSNLYKKRREYIKKYNDIASFEATTLLLEKKKKQLSQKLARNLKKRTINHHFLIHRLVATYFLPKPKSEETVVGHLDFDKTNNTVSNFKWMTAEENQAHQNNSPKVIAERKWRKYRGSNRTKGMKLTSTQVIHIKTQLKRNRPVKQIAKQFDISTMQVWRIRSGENWAHIKIPESHS
ncbi:NUMOD4 domain-containing protein [Riemerella anatipestifer]|uniref:NUMOD4 domain-containing protein n=1 Tax=Riemerella anatipestifer TaxID=34085 RepID=UPI0030C38D17